MENVIAAVVTYNRLSLLRQCIEALRNQTHRPDQILVVDNGSTDGTAAWLDQQPDIVTIHQANIGGAGGFATAIEWSYRQGYHWIWCMDDDGYPQPQALEQLLFHEPHHRALLNCAVINKNDRSSFVWKTKNYKRIDEVQESLIEGVGHPFNGTLIHRAIVDRVGFPNKDFFLWGDETEYYYRIVRQAQIPVYTVSSALHYHPPTAFSLKQDWDYKSTWKMYYYIRNRFHVHRTKFSNRLLAWVFYTSFLLAFSGVILFWQKTDKLKKLAFVFWPAKDALLHNFSATPSFILQRLDSGYKKHSRSIWKEYIMDIGRFLWMSWLPFGQRSKTLHA